MPHHLHHRQEDNNLQIIIKQTYKSQTMGGSTYAWMLEKIWEEHFITRATTTKRSST
jgi:hypothetical protein